MRAEGFSVVDALLALGLLLLLSGALMGLLNSDARLAQVGPAAAELQQRVRAVALALAADLRQAGAGVEAGPHAGSLARLTTAVWPRRIGPGSPDGPNVSRGDAITIVGATSAGQATLAAPLVFDGNLSLTPGGRCPMAAPFCGLGAGDLLLVADGMGDADLFQVSVSTGPSEGIVTDWLAGRSRVYPPGSQAAGVAVRSYFLDGGARQLRQTIQDSSSLPAFDDVIGLEFRYYGMPVPPSHPRPPAGTENCLFDAAGSPVLGILSGDPAGMVELPLTLFSDGPWCGTGPLQFDADLLRVRMIRVALQLEATAPEMRRPGRQALAQVAGAEIILAVAPPGLGGGR